MGQARRAGGAYAVRWRYVRHVPSGRLGVAGSLTRPKPSPPTQHSRHAHACGEPPGHRHWAALATTPYALARVSSQATAAGAAPPESAGRRADARTNRSAHSVAVAATAEAATAQWPQELGPCAGGREGKRAAGRRRPQGRQSHLSLSSLSVNRPIAPAARRLQPRPERSRGH